MRYNHTQALEHKKTDFTKDTGLTFSTNGYITGTTKRNSTGIYNLLIQATKSGSRTTQNVVIIITPERFYTDRMSNKQVH